MNSKDMLALERNLNVNWRASKDYQAWRTGSKGWETDADVDGMFDAPQDVSKHPPVVFEAPKGAVVCPVTGQQAAVCPVTGQSAASETSAVCPVTGQKDSPSEQQQQCPMVSRLASSDDTCPVTGYSGASCPVSNANQSNAPETEQSTTAA